MWEGEGHGQAAVTLEMGRKWKINTYLREL
jgi:hypothetical protein